MDLTPTQLDLIPATPGIYIYKNTRGEVMYVGKAKVLKNRVRSYFRPSTELEPAKQQMVKEITAIETITTDTEQEALILEANLIQKYRPPYNVVLRDDKYYLFIKITREDYPRIFLVRRLKKDGARYFGPYSSAQSVRATLKLLQRIFPHRGEKDRPHDYVFPHPLFTPRAKSVPRSLEEGELSSHPDIYQQNIKNIIRFLKGDRDDIIATLQAGMADAAAHQHYERAAIFRNQIEAIRRLGEQQKVYLPHKESLDIVSVASAPTHSAINVFSFRDGKLLAKNTFLLKHKPATNTADIIRQFILQYYAVAQNIPPTIALPLLLPDAASLAQWINHNSPPQFFAPQRGPKKDLIELGTTNAQQLLTQEATQFFGSERVQRAQSELARYVQIAPGLHRIETYDISNIQGTLATGSMVVFIEGQAQPKLYKKFKIKTQTTPNDFAMLQEVLARRFSQRNTDWPLPDLIIMDGGKGQLSAAKKILDQLGVDRPLIALAKRQEEIFTLHQSQPIHLPYDSDSLYLIQRMRDEAHRFTITYHRLLRSRAQRQSILDEIPGIGPTTKRKLLRHFGSLQAIRQASIEQLREIVGSKAETIKDYL